MNNLPELPFDKLKAILDSLPGGVYVFQNDNVLFFNKVFCDLVGFPEEEVRNNNLDDLLDLTPNGRANARKIYQQVQAGELEEFKWDNPVVRPDGKKVVLRGNVRRFQCADGFGVMITLQDITRRRNAENEAAEQARLFRLIGENSSDFIYVHDRKNRLSYVSPAVKNIAGYAPEEWGQAVPQWVVEGPLMDHAREATDLAVRTGEKQPAYTVEIKRKDGSSGWLEVNETPYLKDGEVSGIIGVARDITDRINHEEKLQALNEKLEIRNRALTHANQEMEAFIYTVSHDLKAPLVTLHGMTDRLILKSADKLDDKGKHYLERISVNVSRLEDLVLDLLKLSRIGRIEDAHENFEIAEILRESIDESGETISRFALEIVADQEIGLTHYSRKRLRQVFTNLIINAAKYSDPQRKALLTVAATEETERWHIEMRDNGRGIDPKFHEKIFQAFQRPGSYKTDEGTGIGLAVVKRIIEFNHGEVWVSSEPGIGSVFNFTIPKAIN